MPGLFAELRANVLDDGTGGAAHGLHRERRKEVGECSTDEQSDHHVGVRQVELDTAEGGIAAQAAGVLGEQDDRRERRRADCVALGDGLGGVAHGVQGVGDGADFLGKLGHLGDATGVVGDGAEGVDGDDDAGHREHRRAATPMPKMPASTKLAMVAITMTSTGSVVDCMPTARPWMMFVPAPVSDAAAMDLTGLYWVEV